MPTYPSPDAEKLHTDPIRHHISCRIHIACTPATLYAIWTDVAAWHVWDPDTRWAYLDGPFTIATQGRIAPKKGPSVAMIISEATPNQSFTVVCHILGSAMHFEHDLQATHHGVHATHRVRFTGWLSPLLMRTVGAGIEKGLPQTMRQLKARCEALQSQSTDSLQ